MAVIIGIAVVAFLLILVISAHYGPVSSVRLPGYSGVSEEDFVEHFSTQGIPSSLSRTVYDTFKQKVKSQEFQPSPEMRIEEVFHQADEDTFDDALQIMMALQIPTPPDDVLARWDGPNVKTLSDLVLWIDWVRRQQ